MPDFFDINTYHYDLPPELIAQFPLVERSNSRLLCLSKDTGRIEHRVFSDLKNYLKPGDVLVVNSTKVFPARLFAKKENGTELEVFLLNNTEGSSWRCLLNPGKRIKQAQWLFFSDALKGFVQKTDEEGIFTIELDSQCDLMQEIERIGHVPLPPYIQRGDQAQDKNTYQTVYASQTGSVAAPTAGLHFTQQLISDLQKQGIQITEVVLHVGLGTFKPVTVHNVTDHKMHSEYCSIDKTTADLINLAKQEKRRVIAVGTTSVRTLESFWDKETKHLNHGDKWTDIFLYPGKDICVVDALITNYHLPKSTLLMLVTAFAGYENTMKAYAEAVTLKYRFFSYGDAMFIL